MRSKYLNKAFKACIGFYTSIWLNIVTCFYKLLGRKVYIFQLHAANQLPHIDSVLRWLCAEKISECIVLVGSKEISIVKSQIGTLIGSLNIASYHSTSFLLFWDAVIGVDQRMRFPLLSLSQGLVVCMFHGQPTKGNVYSGFNFQQIDVLFFYGPMMRDHYFKLQAQHPEWSKINTWNIGQPKSDLLFSLCPNRQAKAISMLGLDPRLKTVVYAPSFESCASMASHGKQIIDALMSVNCNLVVKPHPSFYRVYDKSDEYFFGVPRASEWRDLSDKLSSMPKGLFPLDKQLDTEVVLAASDVLLTDHSGIAFDAILLDIPVIYFDCPDFFSKYLPDRFGIDGIEARDDNACNAGRSAGQVVSDIDELINALHMYFENPRRHAEERCSLRDTLLFNQGKATERFIEVLTELTRKEV